MTSTFRIFGVCMLASITACSDYKKPESFMGRHTPEDTTVYVIKDEGGYFPERMQLIKKIEADDGIHKVAITGFCNSACTFYQSLSKACTYKDVTFGFHGPSYNGLKMPEPLYDYATRRRAAVYPPEIGAWYLAEARHVVGDDVLIKTGAELIEAGHIKEC